MIRSLHPCVFQPSSHYLCLFFIPFPQATIAEMSAQGRVPSLDAAVERMLERTAAPDAASGQHIAAAEVLAVTEAKALAEANASAEVQAISVAQAAVEARAAADANAAV